MQQRHQSHILDPFLGEPGNLVRKHREVKDKFGESHTHGTREVNSGPEGRSASPAERLLCLRNH